MVLAKQKASVGEGSVGGGRVDEGNERGRDGTRHGRWEGGSEQRRDCARKGGSKGAMEGNFYTSRKLYQHMKYSYRKKQIVMTPYGAT